MGVTAGCTVLHYVTPAANFYPSALPRFWRNPLFIRDVATLSKLPVPFTLPLNKVNLFY